MTAKEKLTLTTAPVRIAQAERVIELNEQLLGMQRSYRHFLLTKTPLYLLPLVGIACVAILVHDNMLLLITSGSLLYILLSGAYRFYSLRAEVKAAHESMARMHQLIGELEAEVQVIKEKYGLN